MRSPVKQQPESRAENPAGLCQDCAHARPIASAKGSEFVLCELSFSDSRFAKYPRLPVLTCSGYAPEIFEKVTK
jgi:hypothetical protein